MAEFKSIRRVTVYAEESLEDDLLSEFLRLGAHGYTVVECRGGRGEHAVFGDPLSGISERVRIELLVDPAIGEKILEYLSGPQFSNRPLLACMETVQVTAKEHF